MTSADVYVGEPSALRWLREACDHLHAEPDRLPGRYRLPLLLCYMDGKIRDEAAGRPRDVGRHRQGPPSDRFVVYGLLDSLNAHGAVAARPLRTGGRGPRWTWAATR